MPRLHKYRNRNACYVLTAIRANADTNISTLEQQLDAEISRLYGLTPEGKKIAVEAA